MKDSHRDAEDTEKNYLYCKKEDSHRDAENTEKNKFFVIKGDWPQRRRG